MDDRQQIDRCWTSPTRTRSPGPGADGIDAWLGIRAAGELVAVGAVLRMADRHRASARGVGAAGRCAGAGWGRRSRRALTARALASGSGVASLGVYVDNPGAVAIYDGLGYAVAHTFASGAVRS